MSVSVTILGSGSDGNATLIRSGSFGILIDAGLTRKQVYVRLEKLNIPRDTIKAIVLTHDHSDHIKGARLIADDLKIPTYLTSTIFKELHEANKLGNEVFLFDPGTVFELGPFSLTPFEIPHDTLQPVGFVVESDDKKIGLATDLGSITNYVKSFLKGCDSIILESDYDKKMLMASNRPLHLKRKIMGQFGHLDNQQVVDSLKDIVTKETRHIFLVHLSRKCNSEDIVYKSAIEKLEELHCLDLSLHVVSSVHCPYPTVEI